MKTENSILHKKELMECGCIRESFGSLSADISIVIAESIISPYYRTQGDLYWNQVKGKYLSLGSFLLFYENGQEVQICSILINYITSWITEVTMLYPEVVENKTEEIVQFEESSMEGNPISMAV